MVNERYVEEHQRSSSGERARLELRLTSERPRLQAGQPGVLSQIRIQSMLEAK